MTPDRRIAIAALAALPLLAACNGTSVTAAQIAEWIKQVQGAVAKACSIAGTVVPEANAVLALLTQLVGGNVALVTAATVAQAVSAIAGAVCPAPQAGRLGAEEAVPNVTIDGVPISFIKFK